MRSSLPPFGATSVRPGVFHAARSSLIPRKASRIIWAEGHGILAASLVINRRLYKIASTSSVSITRAQRMRAIYIDLAIGLGIPILAMILSESTDFLSPVYPN